VYNRNGIIGDDYYDDEADRDVIMMIIIRRHRLVGDDYYDDEADCDVIMMMIIIIIKRHSW
jgi:hypothetical protein